MKLLRRLACFLFDHRWCPTIVMLPCGHCEDLHSICERCGDARVRPWIHRWNCPEHCYYARALKAVCPRDSAQIANIIAPKELL